MINTLFDFARKRTALQALGFYGAYLLGSFVLALVMAIIVGLSSPNDFVAADRGAVYGLVLSILLSLGLLLLVVFQKGLYHGRRSQVIVGVLVLVTLVLSLVSIITGLLPAALLTMRAPKTPTLYADEPMHAPASPTQAI